MGAKKRFQHALEAGQELHWYKIKGILGQGGFGITYLAEDTNLQHDVAIKEYLPIDLSVRTKDGAIHPYSHEHQVKYYWGLERFLEEARTLGQFRHPNIVSVRNVFEANNTAYMIMDYELGETFQELLIRRKRINEEDIKRFLFPIAHGLKLVHAAGFIHRDIKPANIFIRADSEPVILDFGSARQSLDSQKETLASVFSRGYAPIEQYFSHKPGHSHEEGPWTDVYSLAATAYRAMTGIAPIDAIDRRSSLAKLKRDTFVTSVEICGNEYSHTFLKAIDAGLRFSYKDRPQSLPEWLSYFDRPADFEATFIPTLTRFEGDSILPLPDLEAEPEKKEDITEPAAQKDSDGDIFTHLEETTNMIFEAAFFKETEIPFNIDQVKASAASGEALAQARLAYLYGKGERIDKDLNLSIKWYKEAAGQGHVNSQFNLGLIYVTGRGVKKDYAEGLKWLKLAAKQGDMAAQSAVARMFALGKGTKANAKSAIQWYSEAAENGDSESQFKLAQYYYKGDNIEQDYVKAFEWYNRAAIQGHAKAQFKLAYLYGKGLGVKRDDNKSIIWFHKAAENGHDGAQYNLGVIYSKGRGVEKDIQTASKWYGLAAAQGNKNARSALNKSI